MTHDRKGLHVKLRQIAVAQLQRDGSPTEHGPTEARNHPLFDGLIGAQLQPHGGGFPCLFETALGRQPGA